MGVISARILSFLKTLEGSFQGVDKFMSNNSKLSIAVVLRIFCHVFFFLDNLSDNEFRINKGVFVAICLIILMVGIAVGGVLCLLVYRKQRRNHKKSKNI